MKRDDQLIVKKPLTPHAAGSVSGREAASDFHENKKKKKKEKWKWGSM